MFNISEVVTNSLKLAWRHKMLWILALMIGGGSINMGNNVNFDELFPSEDDDQAIEQNTQNLQNENNVTTNVNVATNITVTIDGEVFTETEFRELVTSFYGEVSDEDFYMFLADIGKDPDSGIVVTQSNPLDSVDNGVGGSVLPVLSKEPPFPAHLDTFFNDFSGYLRQYSLNIFLITLVFVLYVAFSIAIYLIARSWVQGAYFNGIHRAIDDTPYSFRDFGTWGRTHARELVKFNVLIVITSLVLFLVLAVSFGIFIIPMAGGIQAIVPLIMVAVLFMLLTVPFYIVLNYISKFAPRFVSLKSYDYITAIKSGYRLFTKNLINALLLSFTNCAVYVVIALGVGLASLVIVLSAIGVVGMGSTLVENADIKFALLLLGSVVAMPLFIAFMLGILALQAYLTTYANFTWNYFFKYLSSSVEQSGTVTEVQNESS